MEITDFFTPVDWSKISSGNSFQANTLGSLIDVYSNQKGFPDLSNTNVAIIGVNEERRAIDNEGCSNGPDNIRPFLYKLFKGNYEINIADLGNIKGGHTVEDTDFALKSVINELLKKRIVPIIIGGSQDLTYANYLAYEDVEATINLVAIDPTFDIGDVEDSLNSQSWLGKVLLHQPNHLFNYSNIGYQTYFVNPDHVNLINKMFFDSHRLGQVRTNLEEVEPIVRNADVVSIDISAVRQSDAIGCAHASPNGFYGEELCQIARYAGMSDKLSSIGIYEYNPLLDKNKQTAHLVAQMIWCFIDGYYNRKKDFPFKKTTDYLKYRVFMKDLKSEVIFYKSKKTDRWWMEVPYPVKKNKYKRHLIVPCSYSSYETALKEEVPDKWWQTYQKLG